MLETIESLKKASPEETVLSIYHSSPNFDYETIRETFKKHGFEVASLRQGEYQGSPWFEDERVPSNIIAVSNCLLKGKTKVFYLPCRMPGNPGDPFRGMGYPTYSRFYGNSKLLNDDDKVPRLKHVAWVEGWIDTKPGDNTAHLSKSGAIADLSQRGQIKDGIDSLSDNAINIGFNDFMKKIEELQQLIK